MKRNVKTLITLLLALLLTFSLCACGGDNTEAPEGAGTVTLVIAGEETVKYTVNLDNLSEGDGIIPLFEYLRDTEGVAFEMNGTMVEMLGELTNDAAANSWIYIYTSVTADADVSEHAETVEYEGKTLTSSGVGANQMHLEGGAVIYVTTITF